MCVAETDLAVGYALVEGTDAFISKAVVIEGNAKNMERSALHRAGLKQLVPIIVALILGSAGLMVSGTASAAHAAVVGDNYPAKYKSQPLNAMVDEWNFYSRNCTSFVAWRLNSTNGVKFTNQYGGVSRWGNAKEWGGVAKSLGIKVDSTPAVGAVAWSNVGGTGHVAWVAEVKAGGQIVVEDYNHNYDGKYAVRTVPSSSFTGFIHIKDLGKPLTSTPSPSAKSSVSQPSKLNSTVGQWKPAPVSLSYRWQRNKQNIANATSASYALTNADYGTRVRVQVTGSKPGYTTKSTYSQEYFAAKVTSKSGYKYVNIRAGADAKSKLLGQISSGKMVPLRCYAMGSTVTGPYGKSSIWYAVPGVGWVADALLETNTNATVTPKC